MRFRIVRTSLVLASSVAAAALGIGVAGYGAPLVAAAANHANSQTHTGESSCSKAGPRSGSAATVPVTLVKAPGGQVPTVAVCLGKRGPYTFVVDTGSSQSIIDSKVASALHLPSAGSSSLGGDGCVTSGELVKVPALHAGNLSMHGQAMVRGSLTNWDTLSVDGVLGSDVFGRFKALKLDPSQATLTVLGSEGPAPKAHSIVIGRTNVTPPSALVKGKVLDTVPLTVVTAPGNTAPFANMAVTGQGPYAFVVATGAPTTTLDETAGYTDHLSDASTAPAPAGIGCTGSVPVLQPGAVSIGSTSHDLSMLAIHIPGQQRVGVVGYLGLDYLTVSGPVIVDYAGAEMSFLSS